MGEAVNEDGLEFALEEMKHNHSIHIASETIREHIS